jgi:hypothetical protein
MLMMRLCAAGVLNDNRLADLSFNHVCAQFPVAEFYPAGLLPSQPGV